MVRLLDGTAPSWRDNFLNEHWDGTPDSEETDVGQITYPGDCVRLNIELIAQ